MKINTMYSQQIEGCCILNNKYKINYQRLKKFVDIYV